MVGTTAPWWREVFTRTVRGIRAGVAAFFRPVKKKPALEPAALPHQEKIREEETALTEKLTENFPPPHFSNPDADAEAGSNAPSTAGAPDEAGPAPEPVSPVSHAPADAPPPAASADPPPQNVPQELPQEAENPPESPADLLAEAALGLPSATSAAEPEGAAPPPEEGPGDVPESPADLLAEAAREIDLAPEAPLEPPPSEPSTPEPSMSEPAAAEPSLQEGMVESPAVAEIAEPEAAEPEALLAEVAAEEPQQVEEPGPQTGSAAEPPESVQQASAETPASPEEPAAEAGAVPSQSQSAALPPQAASAPPQAAQVVHEAIKREQGPDTSPVSVVVSQVYEGPFDLLLDLIRKQDIDIYDIPIAKITAQFLAYVNQLKAGDMDVAGEFIYTASLLIHIKSKMLLPREPRGDDAQEDPRRELVERLLEHERFKNAAQMLQQKQMLEAASWTNPGMREFVVNAGESEIGPEIAADTTDLVRVFREILERARNRPVIDVQEDSVTVGQMIQFLGRRLTMEDKPIALRRLLAHTQSERALIAMFLALLELVRLQAILLRQDRHFSDIFIKKNSGFEAVMNQGLARDDWQ